MILETAILLALISAAIEIYMVFKLAWMKTFVKKYGFLAICFSFALSWFLGLLFGAEGTIVMLGGVGSTLLTALFYSIWAVFTKPKTQTV